ncbi:GntR family transcriptional regulator/MocR family aminotransferase [Herbihabitans rhizosphaerae]|uniref:GntR family transcriptional regulator/MocR family aminotransferase n=1 Tax=Herbihabitans rhizosphaerae TaxID=1872711 RepID=A0A4Q7KH60_9PSEU|nr:PLP-dependent aminotransferase family protein [Herbihabitans rhizosphaerae]RZS34230.1 GntR family transcriptional regulator/MocR family aminotransferase [Herbihabitans rhizosphaerae]
MQKPVFPLTVDRGLARPISTQIADAIRAAAVTGVLRQGDRLPSTRDLAGQLGVSRTVTAAAYDQLHAEGWLTGRHGSGTYIAATCTTAKPCGREFTPTDAVASVNVIDLAPGAPCTDSIDGAAWRRAWRTAGDRSTSVRPERAGLPEYGDAVARHLLLHRGVRVGPTIGRDDRIGIVATGGTTAALAEVAATVLRPGDAVAVEEPGYQRAAETLRSAGVRVVPVQADGHGLNPESIPAEVKAVYCAPAHQHPLGCRLTAERRVTLIKRARDEGWLIIEDDYDGELRHDLTPSPVLAALAPDIVIHLGSANKIISPVLGTGWMVASVEVLDAVLAHRRALSVAPAVAGQLVLTALAETGDLARHLRRVRRDLSERRRYIVRNLKRGTVSVDGAGMGAHVVLPLPDDDAEQHVLANAKRGGILLDGLGRHHAGPPRFSGIVLGYAACTRDQLSIALPIVDSIVAQVDRR